MIVRISSLSDSFITRQEGDKLRAYWDGPKPIGGPVGGWAISRGIHASDVNEFSVWTQEKSNERFHAILQEIADGICPFIEPELSDPQLAACQSITYNLENGIEKFKESDILKLINEGKPNEAADKFLDYCHSQDANGKMVVNQVLLDRLTLERALFLSGTAQPEPVSPPQKPPQPAPSASGGIVNPIKKIQTARPLTKTLLGIVVILGSALQDPTVQATIAGYASHHKGLASAIAAIAAIAALMHEPQGKQ